MCETSIEEYQSFPEFRAWCSVISGKEMDFIVFVRLPEKEALRTRVWGGQGNTSKKAEDPGMELGHT